VFKLLSLVAKVPLFVLALTFTVSATGCQWFPESTFQLARESRLPKWFALPSGLPRANVSVEMSYYTKPWGSSATFKLKNERGQTLERFEGKCKGSEPFRLKHQPSGFPPGYPAYEVITINGVTETIEHRKQEPIFYITDDPAVLKELGADRN
jgi:hypothetical protein